MGLVPHCAPVLGYRSDGNEPISYPRRRENENSVREVFIMQTLSHQESTMLIDSKAESRYS